MIVTYKYRIKDGTKKDLLKGLNEVIRRKWKESRELSNKSTINPLIRGASKLLDINSQTIQAAAHECLLRTRKAKKNVRFRSGKKNLGWVPFNGQTVKFHGS